jgi:hypothetical protein
MKKMPFFLVLQWCPKNLKERRIEIRLIRR